MKHLPFGLRTLKTALSVALSVFLARLFTAEADGMFYAALGGLVAMDTTLSRSLRQGLTQFFGVFLGTMVGYWTHFFLPQIPFWSVGLGVLLLILLCNCAKISYSISLACIVFLSACSFGADGLLSDAFQRLIYTALGLGVALLINVALRPYNNKNRILRLLRQLQSQFPDLLREILVEEHFPDTQKLIVLLRSIDAEIDLYHSQRYFHRKHDAEALVCGCRQLGERMVAELEVICGMDTFGDIASDNVGKLAALGIDVSHLPPRKCTRRDTIVMNYHLEKLLLAYEYLDNFLQE
ncbi:MAG: FUSC family protein [Oscillospiraceae bacterium]|nr:FUSC family protein [Oscillospiraceae bacterium]